MKTKFNRPQPPANLDFDYKHNWLYRILYGLFMGVSDGIPGYSGGTTLTLLNYYDNVVGNIKGIFKPYETTKWWHHLLWSLPFLVSWLIFFIVFHFIVREIGDANFTDFLAVLFASFALACIPFFIIVNKPKTFKKGNWKGLISFLIGFVLIIAISVIIFTLKLNVNTSAEFNNNAAVSKVFQANPSRNATFIFSGLLGGFFLLIPGISGSMIVYIFNEYWTLNHIITDVISHPFANSNVGYLVLFVIFVLIGVISSIFFSAWMLKKHRDIFFGFSFGMVASSFIAILLLTPESTWTWPTQENIHIGLIVLAIIIGIGLNGLFLWMHYRKAKKQNNFFIKN